MMPHRLPLVLVIPILALASGCRTSAPKAGQGASTSPPVALVATPTPTPLPLAEPLRVQLSEAAGLLRQNNAATLEALEKLEPTAKSSAVLSEQLAGLYEELDFTDKLFHFARQATQLDPTYSPGFVRLGRVEQYLGYYTTAQKHLEEAVRLAPQSSDAHTALALLYKHQDKHELAEKSLLAARQADPQEWRLCVLINQERLAQKKYPEALAILDEAERVSPGKGAILLQRTITVDAQATRARETGKTGEAEALWKDALTLAQETVKKLPEVGPAWYHLGKILRNQGDLKGATDAWEKAVALAPTYLSVRYQLGTLYQKLGNKARAQELFNADTEDKQRSDAYQQLNLQVAQAPDNLLLREKLAHYCIEHKLIHRAIFEWEQIAERAPSRKDARQMAATLKQRRLKEMTQ